tara:strand:- start:2143 stop:2781 length:639 start_codon:yes stop_codon:yes gene_type:complete
MTLQASGVISLADLRDEFGDATGSVSLARYYAGTQGEVPPPISGSGQNPNIPVSGSSSSIALNDFYSAQNFYQMSIVSVKESSDKLSLFRGANQFFASNNFGDPTLYNLDGQMISQGYDSFNGGFLVPGRFINVSSNDKASVMAWTTCTMLNTTTGISDKFINGVTALISPGTPIAGSANRYKWYVSVTIGNYGPYDPVGSQVKTTFENNGN